MLDGLLHIAGAWGAYGTVVAVLFAFSILFTFYYSDRRDREPFAMVVTILALTFCLSAVALFPVDIFLVSRIMDPATGLRRAWATDEAILFMQQIVKIVYYIAYGGITTFCFFLIPLAYFYFEELDEELSVGQRLVASLKYTVLFILIACILLLTGLFMKPSKHENTDLDWFRKLIADLDVSALAFVAGVLALAGMCVLVFYTAPGLSILPIHLLAGVKSIPAQMQETHAELAANRERQNAILNRYTNANHQQLSDRDRDTMQELSREELILENRCRMVQRARDSCFNRCKYVVRPIEIILGITTTSLTILLILSIAITTVDNLKGEVCGAPCGYLLVHPDLPNPLNLLFLKLSPYFPVDYILMVMIVLYMFWATTKGIISIGIRFLWVNLYKFRRAATAPQGLLAATMLLMLSLAGLCYSLTMAVAPDYSMFGSQKYCNHTIALTNERDCHDYPTLIVPCHIGAPSDLCTPTVTSGYILGIILATPVLGIAFYYLQWLFLLAFLFALIWNLVRGFIKGFGVDPFEESAEDIDDLETRGLLSAIGAMSADSGRRRAGKRGLLIPGGGSSYGSIETSGLRSSAGNSSTSLVGSRKRSPPESATSATPVTR